MTYERRWLVNVRRCNETFTAANGETAVAKIIGDMPVLARRRDGSCTLRRAAALEAAAAQQVLTHEIRC